MWDDLLSGGGEPGGPPPPPPPDANQRLYFRLAAGSVLLSAGRYEPALDLYDDAEAEAELLPAGHPNRAVVHSCRAFALNALGQLDLAFEELVKVCWDLCKHQFDGHGHNLIMRVMLLGTIHPLLLAEPS